MEIREEATAEYGQALVDLHEFSKPEIKFLTMLAKDHVQHAAEIVGVIEAHIQKSQSQPHPQPQPQQPQLHPRLRYRGRHEQTFTIPQTEDWDNEATQASSALPITQINWENDWSRRCVCGARPGRCQH